MKINSSKYETDLQVRPDDIDMNHHVHNSRYFDYVLAARYDQMERCYKMPMEEFIRHGFGWVIGVAHVEYKRPLKIGDKFRVQTWIEEISESGVKVSFTIKKLPQLKLSCEGFFDYTMISMATGRAEKIPDWIVERYSI